MHGKNAIKRTRGCDLDISKEHRLSKLDLKSGVSNISILPDFSIQLLLILTWSWSTCCPSSVILRISWSHAGVAFGLCLWQSFVEMI